ncbi:hypothetical protein E2C01_069098 [Portunus trituberculatus]|uniref:Uncharacterized protein n=1 Tax=Portunus trituberculatus TaxID=210409 RepID=A0A5B7I1W8_PORTR|nr:hypothetical protein [Portunus trituberculatus]
MLLVATLVIAFLLKIRFPRNQPVSDKARQAKPSQAKARQGKARRASETHVRIEIVKTVAINLLTSIDPS